MNVNLNLFLKMLGATNEIICDDQKTLEFMFDIKNKIDALNKAPDETQNSPPYGKEALEEQRRAFRT